MPSEYFLATLLQLSSCDLIFGYLQEIFFLSLQEKGNLLNILNPYALEVKFKLNRKTIFQVPQEEQYDWYKKMFLKLF